MSGSPLDDGIILKKSEPGTVRPGRAECGAADDAASLPVSGLYQRRI